MQIRKIPSASALSYVLWQYIPSQCIRPNDYIAIPYASGSVPVQKLKQEFVPILSHDDGNETTQYL